MKKLIAIFILCFLTGVATVNAAYQRHQKQPNFFMPAGAIKNTVNQPNFKPRKIKNKQQPNILQSSQPATSEKNTSLSVKTEKLQAQEPVKTQEQTVVKKETAQLPAENTTVQTSDSEKKVSAKDSKPLPIVQTTPLTSETEPNDEYAQSFREYAEDLQKIAQSEPVYNNRLNKNISDFENKEHLISVSAK